jgi:hypothetical protein
MTSQLNVDTIVDKAGSGGTNVKIANTSVAVAEGGSATTNTVQGLLKLWVNFQSSGTVDDSLNVSSTTDSETVGITTVNITNNMASTSYSFLSGGSDYDNYMCTAALVTSYFPTYSRTDAGVVEDARGYVATAGDLA